MTTANLEHLNTGQPNDDNANEALAMTQDAADAEAAQPTAKGQKKRSHRRVAGQRSTLFRSTKTCGKLPQKQC